MGRADSSGPRKGSPVARGGIASIAGDVATTLKVCERENVSFDRPTRWCARRRRVLPRAGLAARSSGDPIRRNHRDAYEIEPICKVLLIAPAIYRAPAARRQDPTRLSSRPKRDCTLRPEIIRVSLRPKMLRVSDFADVSTGQGVVHVTIVIDTSARRIVGWRASLHRPPAEAGDKPSVMTMTTRWLRPSTGSTTPRSPIDQPLGVHSRRSSPPRWNGSTGSTIAGC